MHGISKLNATVPANGAADETSGNKLGRGKALLHEPGNDEPGLRIDHDAVRRKCSEGEC